MFRYAALLLILLAQAAFGASERVHVIVRGTTTLDPEVVAEMTGVKQKPEIQAKEIKERLDSSGLFSYVNVSRIGDDVYVRVKQKYTFFAFPYISKDYTGTYYAVAAGKQIVLGEDALIAGRYQFGTSDHEGFGLIRDGAILGSPMMAELAFGYEDALHWIYNSRNIVSQTENKYHGGHFMLGYRLYPYLDVRMVNYVEQHDFEEINGLFYSGLQWSVLGEVNYDRLYQETGLSRGFKITWDFEETPSPSGFQFWRTKIEPTVVLLQRDPLNWVLRGSASFSPTLPRYQKAELGGEMLRGYEPEEFRVDYYGIIQNDFYLTSSNLWKLNLRSLAFADWGFVAGQGRPGTGVGLQIYPKNIAVSAFQFYVGYGFNPGGYSTALALGTSFK